MWVFPSVVLSSSSSLSSCSCAVKHPMGSSSNQTHLSAAHTHGSGKIYTASVGHMHYTSPPHTLRGDTQGGFWGPPLADAGVRWGSPTTSSHRSSLSTGRRSIRSGRQQLRKVTLTHSMFSYLRESKLLLRLPYPRRLLMVIQNEFSSQIDFVWESRDLFPLFFEALFSGSSAFACWPFGLCRCALGDAGNRPLCVCFQMRDIMGVTVRGYPVHQWKAGIVYLVCCCSRPAGRSVAAGGWT